MAETTPREAREAEEARLRQIVVDRAKELDEFEAKYADVHSVAIVVMNIKVLVPVVLDRAANNYNRWRSLFLVVLGKYALTDHALTDVVHADRPTWVQMDCTVLTWIYGTLNVDLQQSTMLKNPNARIAWLHLEDEFLDQRESRALFLSAEFRTVKQGSLSITDFCRKLETMAANLKDFGDPVGDRTLVLTLLRGLSDKFRPMVTNIKLRQPFPTFAEARTLLLLEEIDLDDVAGTTNTPPAPPPPLAFIADSGPGGRGPSGGRGPPGGMPNQGGTPGGHGHPNGGSGNRQRRRGRGGRQQHPQQHGMQHHGGPRPPPFLYNTWGALCSSGRTLHPCALFTLWRSWRPLSSTAAGPHDAATTALGPVRLQAPLAARSSSRLRLWAAGASTTTAGLEPHAWRILRHIVARQQL
jgi:hypothetical protein